ncbi:Endonuclease/exonuclease/phosphatase [Chlamydoabsidia padenii]|nr:Endonuclease/exonuclease/phosphatase [Chlamydoabsidia padenii]
MLKADTNTRSTKSWSKVQALSSLIQLKSGNSSRSPPNSNNPSLVTHSNTVNNTPHQPSLQPEQQTKVDRLKVFVSTWNMYGNLPKDLDLEPFLTTRHATSSTPATNSTSPPENSKVYVEHHTQNSGGGSLFLDTSTGHPYHLLAIGTQECERDISESLFYSSKEVWEQRLSDYLGDQYKLLRCETLAALHLAVFVWKPVAYYVKNIHSADIKTGWANMVGNKGAVAVSLDFGSQSLLFINCHLRAHQTKLAERNANVQRILYELQIKGGRPIIHSQSSSNLFQLPLKKLAKSSKSMKSSKSSKSTHRNSKGKRSKNNKRAPNKALPIKNDKEKGPNTQPLENTTSSSSPNNLEPDNNGLPLPPPQQQTTVKSSKRSSTSTTNDKKKKSNKKPSITSLSSSLSTVESASVSAEDQHSVTERFDHVFIFGDTNYRINAERQFVLDTIKRQDFKTLLKYDQLTLERQRGTTPLACFNEHPIDFIPTYKFDTLDSADTSESSSTSLPLSQVTETCEPVTAASSTPPTPLTTGSSSSSSHSFVITPKHSMHHFGSVSVRYDTSPKQRVPSWTDRILWHDRQHNKHDGHSMRVLAPPISTSDTSNPHHQPSNKTKLNLKWISALKPKNKNVNVSRGMANEPIDKRTICYHYNTVMDPRLMGASDHLPVIGIFGIWFDDWENAAYRRAKSIKSFKTKVPLWRKWFQ